MHHADGREYWYQYCGWRGAPAAVVALALILGGAVATGMAQERRPNVLTTVAPLTNIVKNVGGPFIDLHGLIPAGSVRFVDTLRDDDLPGTPGSPEHSYIGMMLEDVRTMVTALGGRAEALQGIDPANIP
jgi:ABC-type Zn uptake system ZnuABC Zn-binding protein ZnuA